MPFMKTYALLKSRNLAKFLLCLPLAFGTGAWCFGQNWEEGNGSEIVDGIEWNYVLTSDGGVSIGYHNCCTLPTPGTTNVLAGDLAIPATLGGRPVTVISILGRLDEVSSIMIPDSVTSVDSAVFNDCSDSVFDTATIPGVKIVDGWVVGTADDSITEALDLTKARGICSYAFSGRSDLENVVIGDGVVGIGSSAFANCDSLTNVTISANVTNIGHYAFYGCRGLANESGFVIVNKILFDYDGTGGDVTIPSSVSIIGGDAFEDCFDLVTVTIPDSVTSIGDWAFAGCGGLVGVRLGNGVTSLGDGAFEYCASLSDVTIPGSVTSIGCDAFHGCSGLASVKIGDGVASIGDSAFSECTNLVSVTMPNSLDTIGEDTFSSCEKLRMAWLRTVANISAAEQSGGGAGGGSATISANVALTVTNVVVHYVTASKPIDAVTPPQTTGFVNVVAEVAAGGPVAIADGWAKQFPGFTAKFGSDFTAALTRPTGKRDHAGNAMLVWQDYVAGTDPTDENDVFTASISFAADGMPVISHSPEFKDAGEAAKRKYTTYGKSRLNDPVWSVVDGNASDYNFFKVTVEMR